MRKLLAILIIIGFVLVPIEAFAYQEVNTNIGMKATYYKGSRGASGQALNYWSVALNDAQRRELGIQWGDWVYISTNSKYKMSGWYKVLDSGCKRGVVDIWFRNYGSDMNAYSAFRSAGTIQCKITKIGYKSKKSAGWVNSSRGWWYQYANGNYPYSQWMKYNGSWYYFDKSGYMATGWRKINGSWYYFNKSGYMTTGWNKINGSWYYLNKSGYMTTGWNKVNGTWYYHDKSGYMKTGWNKVSGSWYYLDKSGSMATGWRKVNSSWYYLKSSGKCAYDWNLISGLWYYLDPRGESGRMITGEHTINGIKHLFGGDGIFVKEIADIPTMPIETLESTPEALQENQTGEIEVSPEAIEIPNIIPEDSIEENNLEP